MICHETGVNRRFLSRHDGYPRPNATVWLVNNLNVQGRSARFLTDSHEDFAERDRCLERRVRHEIRVMRVAPVMVEEASALQ